MELLNQYVQQFSALADQFRLKILLYLYLHGEQCVCEICDYFKIGQSNISYHLKILCEANLLQKRQVAVWNYYSLNKSNNIYPLLTNLLQNIKTKD